MIIQKNKPGTPKIRNEPAQKERQKSPLSINGLGGWSGGAKVSCTSGHRGVQLILAYSWARPVILVAGKGRRGMFLFLLFLHFHSCSSFFPVLSFISSISFLPVSGRRHKMTHKGWCVVKPQHNQSINGLIGSSYVCKITQTVLSLLERSNMRLWENYDHYWHLVRYRHIL